MTSDICILIIDDDMEILASFKQSLNEFGKRFCHKLDVKIAKNVLEALKIIYKHRIDAIFLDYHFKGGMSGDDLIDKLPSHLDSLYITLISGRDEQELTKIVTRRHTHLDQQYFPFRYLAKPVSDLQLRDVYHSIIGFCNRKPLPSPLAYASRAIDESETNFRKIKAIENFLETTVKYLTIILVSDTIYRKSHQLLPLQVKRDEGYGFSIWLTWFQQLCAQEKTGIASDFIPEISEFLSEQLSNQETPLKFMIFFQDVINERGFFNNEESYYGNLIQELNNRLIQFKNKLHFLTHYSLLAVEEVNFDESNSDLLKCRSRVLMGLDSRPTIKEINFPLSKKQDFPTKRRKIYLSNSLGQFLLLHPFIKFHYCENCKSRQIFVIDAVYNDKINYMDIMNHPYENDSDFEEFQTLIVLKEDNFMLSQEHKIPPTPNKESPKFSVPTNIKVSMTEYQDFQLIVSSNYEIRASSDQSGETRDKFQLDMNDIELSLELIRSNKTNSKLLKTLGSKLYKALFPANILNCLSATKASAAVIDQGIRLRLIFNISELAALPWEFLYDEQLNIFLANNTQTVLSRYIDVPLKRQEIQIASLPLKMLVVISSPKNLQKLDTLGEETLIRESLKKHIEDGRIKLDILHEATRRNITQKLREESYNVFHFIGHGIFENDQGYIALVDEDGYEKRFDDEAFANFFLGGGNRNPSLVVLNSCQSASISSNRAFVGVAPNLVQRGIPAVVAMQYSILDNTAKLFADEFYRALTFGLPVDEAIQSTRNIIAQDCGSDKPDFATPVLYMRAKDGVIMNQKISIQ